MADALRTLNRGNLSKAASNALDDAASDTITTASSQPSALNKPYTNQGTREEKDPFAPLKPLKIVSAPNYDRAQDGTKGSLNIPGVFKGSETVQAGVVSRQRSALGGTFNRIQAFETRYVDGQETQDLVRTFKEKSNPFRTRAVIYSETENATTGKADLKRDIDYRLFKTKVGYNYEETAKGRQYTNVNALVYNLQVSDSTNEFKKGVKVKETNTLGLSAERWEISADGKKSLTGFKFLDYSRTTDQTSKTTNTTKISDNFGLNKRTFETPVGAAWNDKTDRFITSRNVGTYSVQASKATETSDAVKVQRLAGVFKRTEIIPINGDEKTVQFSVLGIKASRRVSLTDEEKTVREKQIAESRPKADASAPRNLGQRVYDGLNNAANQVSTGVKDTADYLRKNPIKTAAAFSAAAVTFAPLPAKPVFAAAAAGLGAVAAINEARADAAAARQKAEAVTKKLEQPKPILSNASQSSNLEKWQATQRLGAPTKAPDSVKEQAIPTDWVGRISKGAGDLYNRAKDAATSAGKYISGPSTSADTANVSSSNGSPQSKRSASNTVDTSAGNLNRTDVPRTVDVINTGDNRKPAPAPKGYGIPDGDTGSLTYVDKKTYEAELKRDPNAYIPGNSARTQRESPSPSWKQQTNTILEPTFKRPALRHVDSSDNLFQTVQGKISQLESIANAYEAKTPSAVVTPELQKILQSTRGPLEGEGARNQPERNDRDRNVRFTL